MSNIDDLSVLSHPEKSHKDNNETLLAKFNIPITHFEFDYVKRCNNGDELEKILAVLQSGQEGHFPDLIKETEQRLKIIKPRSKLLRESVRIQTDVPQDVAEDMKQWLQEVSINDKELEERKTKSCAFNSYIDIRKANKHQDDLPQKENKEKRISSTDYESWDKYDPDTEIIKMDLKNKPNTEEIPKSKLKTVTINDYATEAEKTFFSNQERLKGNEFFKSNEFETALLYYTASINIKPTINNLNNRAATYLKLKNYSEAIKDCNDVLKINHTNFKARIRLSEALEKIGKNKEALNNIEILIRQNPNDASLQQTAERLRDKCGNVYQTSRLTITEISE